MCTTLLTSNPDTESITDDLNALRLEVDRLGRELSQVQSELLRARIRRNCEHKVRRLLGIRLGCYEQYPARSIRIPSRYLEAIALPSPAPLISIVTPAYNHARFLERTMRSILDQGFPRLEYIVQDGGSRDGTQEILERYCGRLHRAVSMPDRGQTHALNLGFEHASGDILAYLNSDDLLLPGSLAYVARYFHDHPEVDAVYGHRVFVDCDDKEVGRWVIPPHSDDALIWADYVPQETLFWRRELWHKIGAHFDESFSFAMDWDLLLRFRDAGAKMVCLPRFLGAFRVHDQQKSQAQIASVGEREMTVLRRRCHGRDVTRWEIRRALLPFLLKHAALNRLYWCGLIRY